MNRYPDQYPPNHGAAADPRFLYTGGRTPSPTPSEVEALSGSIIDFQKLRNWRFWARKEWIKWYIIGGLILVLTILIAVFDKQIVNWLTPAGRWMRKLSAGWLIPIAILFVISFPPLFGHEIVAILVGVIWGLGIGFAIVCAGTFIGEVGNFYAFKYLCRSRGEKLEKTNLSYSCLAQVVREGGFKMALIIRLSVIPGHFSTAVFSTCGMGITTFALAALLSLPKQLVTVYIGVVLEENGTGTTSTKDTIISYAVLTVTTLLTIIAGRYIWGHINRVKPTVIYARRKARQVKMMDGPVFSDNTSTALLHPSPSENDLPLSVTPLRPGGQVSFTPPPRPGSGHNMGYGGYTSTFMQGRYGEPLDERKSMDAVGWESQKPRVADLRGDQWKVTSSPLNQPAPNNGSRSTNPYPPGARTPETPGTYHPTALKPAPRVLQNPFDDANSPDAQHPPRSLSQELQSGPAPASAPAPTTRRNFQLSDSLVSQHAPLPSEISQEYQAPQYPPGDHTHDPSALPTPFAPTARRAFQLSDPPASQHSLLGSEMSHEYEPSLYPPSDHAQDSSLYAHGPEASYESFDSQSPLRGHAKGVTDSSFYTAVGDDPPA